MSPSDSQPKLLFGDFELDLAAYELRRGAKSIGIERRPMDLLILLLERRNQLVSRKEIVERLWGPDVFVEVETGVNTAIRKVRQALGDSPESPRFIETVSRKGYRFIAPVQACRAGNSTHAVTAANSRVMLAVLPFENLSGDPAQNYFSDGLTEETISYLGRIDPERLGVIARTTSMAYKGTRKSIREIGSELNVDYVLESSVRREGKRVRITSQLIRVKDQTHVWASTYDREGTLVLNIQQELATAIANHVELQLSPQRLTKLEPAPNPDAHDLYLHGRYLWNQLSPPTTRRAIEYFTRATEIDPRYALPWSGLADTYATSPINGDADPLEVWPKGREAADHAIQAAPELAEAQTSRGFVKFWLDWEWAAAETAFRRAIELNPSYALAHRMLGILLSHLGQRAESLASAKRARELDPLNATQQALSSQIAFVARDYDAAIRFARQGIAIDPAFWISYVQLGQAYEQVGNVELALEALTQAGRLSGGNSKTLALRGYMLGRQGKTKEAEDVLAALQAAARDRYVPPYAAALIYAGLGKHEAALGQLKRALEVHDVHLAFLSCDPKWDELRLNVRFREIIAACEFNKPAGSVTLPAAAR